MRRSQNYMLKNVGGQDFLVPLGAQVLASNSLITLNATGRRVWDLLAEDRSLDYLAADIADQFDVDVETARADVQGFLDELESLEGDGNASDAPLDYGTVVREMLGRAAANRQPGHGAFELTRRCNLSCRMCYVRYPVGDRQQASQELSAAAWLELARQAVDAGMVFLLLTGGEVFARRDFFEIYEPLTRMGLVLSLFTNGTLITKDIARGWRSRRPVAPKSLYTAQLRPPMKPLRASAAVTRPAVAGIEALVSHGIPLGLKTTITKQNVGELEAMRQMARNWGLSFSGGWLLAGRPTERLRGGRLPAVRGRLRRVGGGRCGFRSRTGRGRDPRNGRRRWREFFPGNFYCQAGKAAFAISPFGEMNACLLTPQPAARPLEIGFSEAWRQTQHYVDSAPKTASECSNCKVRPYCLRCPAWSLMHTGTLTEPVPYLCEIAHARKQQQAAK